MPLQLEINHDQLKKLCKQWKISEVFVFGSALRDDFRPDSDVDLLIDFEKDAKWSLLHLVRMKEQFSELFQRPVDLITRRGLEQSRSDIRRRSILSTAEPLYANR